MVKPLHGHGRQGLHCGRPSHTSRTGPRWEYKLVAVSLHVEQSRVLAGGEVGFFKCKTGFRQAGVALEKTEVLMLKVVLHSVVTGSLSFRAQVNERFTPKDIELVQACTPAWGQLAVNVYKYIAAPCTSSRAALGAVLRARSSSRRPTQSASTCRCTVTTLLADGQLDQYRRHATEPHCRIPIWCRASEFHA